MNELHRFPIELDTLDLEETRQLKKQGSCATLPNFAFDDRFGTNLLGRQNFGCDRKFSQRNAIFVCARPLLLLGMFALRLP